MWILLVGQTSSPAAIEQCRSLSGATAAMNWRREPRRVAFDGEMASTKDGESIVLAGPAG